VDIFTFVATVVAVTASGALAPGPLFFTNITHGTKSGARGGLAFSVGHMIFEVSLVVVLAVTLQTVIEFQPTIRVVVGVVGGAALLVFAFLQIRGALTQKPDSEGKSGVPSKNPLLLGTLFTGLNPYFILWWLTVGITLIITALEWSFLGVLIMYLSHVWMDYAWLIGTAYLAKRGTNLAGRKGYKLIMIIFSLILVYFGAKFIFESLFLPSSS
jgi:threonine/homoserine/homoserine lactone efflux protein